MSKLVIACTCGHFDFMHEENTGCGMPKCKCELYREKTFTVGEHDDAV